MVQPLEYQTTNKHETTQRAFDAIVALCLFGQSREFCVELQTKYKFHAEFVGFYTVTMSTF